MSKTIFDCYVSGIINLKRKTATNMICKLFVSCAQHSMLCFNPVLSLCHGRSRARTVTARAPAHSVPYCPNLHHFTLNLLKPVFMFYLGYKIKLLMRVSFIYHVHKRNIRLIWYFLDHWLGRLRFVDLWT